MVSGLRRLGRLPLGDRGCHLRSSSRSHFICSARGESGFLGDAFFFFLGERERDRRAFICEGWGF
jgi:hypothetical protein